MMTDLDPTQREQAAQEKRLWVRLTRACNNRCLFCLDADVQDGGLADQAELKEEIGAGARDGCRRLILSGGEPTLHPDYLELIAFGKLAGYDWIQTITNGRMFAYRGFAEQARAAGLNEATFSMHGHTLELHDHLVGVPGAFEQALQGITNLQELGAVVNVDVVINALNIRSLPAILDFFIGKGISEFDLLWLVPFGRAWKNRRDLLCDHETAAAFLHQALTLARRANAVTWTNRLPPNLLEGFEDLIQDPHKLHDEVRGRRSEFEALLSAGNALTCKEKERCQACFIRAFCRVLEEGQTPNLPSEPTRTFVSDPGELEARLGGEGEIPILLNRESQKWIADNAAALAARAGQVTIALESFLSLSDVRKFGVNPSEALMPLRGARVRLQNLPACVLPGAEVVVERIDRPATGDLEHLTDHFILHGYRVHSLGCSACSARETCPGMPINHIRCYGFGILNPLGSP